MIGIKLYEVNLLSVNPLCLLNLKNIEICWPDRMASFIRSKLHLIREIQIIPTHNKKLDSLSCRTRKNDRRETPGKDALWTLDARKCGLETPNAIMSTDARRLKKFSMDAGRLQKFPPGRQTPNLFPPPMVDAISSLQI